MSWENDSQFSSVRNKKGRWNSGSRRRQHDNNSTSEYFRNRNLRNSQENESYRRNGYTLRSAENQRNNNCIEGYIRKNYYPNNNSQKFRYVRPNYKHKTKVSPSISFNDKDCVTPSSTSPSTFQNNTPNTFKKPYQKKANHRPNNKKGKSGKKNSSTSDRLSNSLSSSIIVDPLPSQEENNFSKYSNYSNYICKRNLEFPILETPSASKNSLIEPLTKSSRKRCFSQSSAPDLASQSSRKRNASDKCFSSQSVQNHEKFKEDLIGDEFEIFEKSLGEKSSEPPPKLENSSHSPLKLKSNVQSPAKLESSSQSQLKLESKEEIINDNTGLNVCKNLELENSQSQVLTPFSIPCGQVLKKDNDELDFHTQEDRNPLTSFFAETNSSQLSLTFEEDIKSKELLSGTHSKNGIDSLFNYENKLALHDLSQNSLSIVGTLGDAAINYDSKLFSSPPENKLQKNEIPADSQTSMYNESQFIIPSSQECDSTPSVLPNIKSLQNLSKSLLEKKLLSASTPTTLQNSADSSGAEEKNSADFCEESTVGKVESSNLAPVTPYPLTSTQYCLRNRNLYTPLISPLVAHEQEQVPVISNSFMELLEHPDSSVAVCNDKKNSEEVLVTCEGPSTQPFENGPTNETSSKTNFEGLKIKMENLFEITDCNDEGKTNSLVETANENSDNGEEETLVPTIESDTEISQKNLEDCGNSIDIMSGQNCNKNKEIVVLGSETRDTIDKDNILHNNNEDAQIIFKDMKSNEGYSPYDEIPHQDVTKENEDESKDMNKLEDENEKLHDKLSISQKELCEEYDSKVCNVLNTLKKLFEKKKEKYLNEQISTTFKIKIKDRDGSDLHVEKNSFNLPHFKKNNGDEEPQNIVQIIVKNTNYIKYASVSDKNNFNDYSDQIFCDDKDKIIEEININNNDSEEARTMKQKKKKKKNKKIIDSESSEIVKKIDNEDTEIVKKTDNEDTEIVKGKSKKNKICKSILTKKNWWEDFTENIPDSVLGSPTKDEEDCNEPSNEDLYNSDNASNNENKQQPENTNNNEDYESESANLHQSTIIKKKKNKKKSSKKSKFEKNPQNNEQSSEEGIYKNFPPFLEISPPPAVDTQTTKQNLKSHSQQHLICMNELSRNDDPALSNVRKTLKKKLKRIKDSQKALTPPFQFKKLISKPGKKRHLFINNENQ